MLIQLHTAGNNHPKGIRSTKCAITFNTASLNIPDRLTISGNRPDVE